MISYLILALTISLVSSDTFGERNLEFEERYLKEKASNLLVDLIRTLRTAYEKGSEEFERVINDPDIKGILDHMDGLTRRMAESIINKFKELIKKIDEATKPISEPSKRNLRESSTNLLKKLVQILLNAYKQGLEYFDKVVNDSDVQGILEHLGPLSRKVADGIINQFRELLEKLDEATKENTTIQKRDFKESSISLLKKLTHILTQAFQKGSAAFNEALEDPDVKEILNSLSGISRRTANFMIERFKELIIKIDEVTNDKQKTERGLIDNATKNLKNLIQILIKASKQGSEYFRSILNDPDVIAIREHLNGLEQRIVDSIIKKFLEIFDKIDQATKPESDYPYAVSDWKEDTKVQLKRLTQILLKAYRKGGEYFDKVVNDPDVQNILQHLGPLTRKIANSIIENFRELIEKIDNATKQ